MTAREDQRQLECWHCNELLGSLPYGVGPNGAIHWACYDKLWPNRIPLVPEAQGEAPQRDNYIQREADLLYSRNKWHMLCQHFGINPESTPAATFIDRIERVETGAHPSQDARTDSLLAAKDFAAKAIRNNFRALKYEQVIPLMAAFADSWAGSPDLKGNQDAKSEAVPDTHGSPAGNRSDRHDGANSGSVALAPSPDPPPCLKCGDTLATVQHGNKQGLICMSCRDGELSRCLRIDHMHTPEQGCWELRPTSERLSERAALAPSLPTKEK